MQGESAEGLAPPSEPIDVPSAPAIPGAFRLERRAFELQGGSELTFESDGQYRGQLIGPGDDRVEGELDPGSARRLRDIAAAFAALDRDEYIDANVRDGLRVTYTLVRADEPDRVVRCANRFPPPARALEQIVREQIAQRY